MINFFIFYMTNKTIYTVSAVKPDGGINYSTTFYDITEASAFIKKMQNNLNMEKIGLEFKISPLQLQTIFENGKFTETTTYFDGWQLPEKERKLLIEFCEADAGANIYSEHIFDVGSRIDVNNAIEYGCDDEELNLAEVKKILEDAQNAGVDTITFYR